MASLTLVRGIPGSGKSTLAHKLMNHLTSIGGSAIVVEADMFFVNNQGEYKFDASKLGEAHRWCQSVAMNSLEQGVHVFVSNTFTTKKELRPYFEMAKELGLTPMVITAQGNFKNVHNVPEDKLSVMRGRFEHDISSLYEEFNG